MLLQTSNNQTHSYNIKEPTHCKLRNTPLSRAQKCLIVAIDMCSRWTKSRNASRKMVNAQVKRHTVDGEVMENDALRSATIQCNKIRLTSGHITRNTQSNKKGETRSVRQHQQPNNPQRNDASLPRITVSQQALLAVEFFFKKKTSQTSSTACIRARSKQPNEETHERRAAQAEIKIAHYQCGPKTHGKNLPYEAEHVHLGNAKHADGVVKSKCIPPEIWQFAASTNTL